MASNLDHVSTPVDDLRANFLELVRFYEKTVTTSWFYGVRLPKSNKHSLAAALGLSSPDEVKVVLSSVDLCKKDKNGEWKLVMKVEKWISGMLKEWFPSSNYINKCKSPCSGEGYRNKGSDLFIHLGGTRRNMDDAVNFPNPKDQKFSDNVPTEHLGLEDARQLRHLQYKLRGSVRKYMAGSGSKSVDSNKDVPKDSNSKDLLKRSLGDTTAIGSEDNLSGKDGIQKHADASILRDALLKLSSAVAYEQNSKIMLNYQKIGVPIEELLEYSLSLLEAEMTKQFLFRKLLNIPIIPLMMKKVIAELLKVGNILQQELFQDYMDGAGHEFSTLILKKPTSICLFKRNCKEKNQKLPRAMVQSSKYNNLSAREKEQAISNQEVLNCQWIIEALIEDSDTGMECVRKVAQSKLNMSENIKMPASEVGGMMRLCKLTPTGFHGIKTYLETYYGQKMFCSRADVKALHDGAIVPTVNTWEEGGMKINYWYNDLEDIILQFVKDQMTKKPEDIIEKVKRIHLIVAGDHGQGIFRMMTKILLLNSNEDRAKVPQEGIAPLGEIDHEKDSYEILKNTLIPKIDKMVENILKKSVVVSQHGVEEQEPFTVQLADETSAHDENNIILHTKYFLSSDLKFDSDVLGKVNRSMHYCIYCNLLHSEMRDASNNGNLWSQEKLAEILWKNYRQHTKHRGVSDPALIKSIEVADFLFPILHEMLGTGNDIML